MGSGISIFITSVAVLFKAQNSSRSHYNLATRNYGTADEPPNSITIRWAAAVLVVIGVGAVSSSFTAALLIDGPFKTVIWYPIMSSISMMYLLLK